MNKKVFIVVALLAILGGSAVVSALYTISWTQTLTIPSAAFTVYRGSTQIAVSSNQTSGWSWTGSNFTMTITIYNTGTSTITPTITSDTSWTLAPVSMSSIVAGGNQQVLLTVTPPDLNAGTTSGPFAVTVSA
jgi:hypothetical protein